MVIPGKPFAPMEPQLRGEPFDDDNYLFQVKWDGVRCLAHLLEGEVRLYNRRQRPRTVQYPELQQLVASFQGKTAVFDGELVVLAEGRSSFPLILNRDFASNPQIITRLQEKIPVHYMIFDLAYCEGQTLIHQPLQERLEILNSHFQASERFHQVESFSQGTSLFAAVQQQKLEGIVAKKRDSKYLVGKKTSDWMKIKCWQFIRVNIGGYTLRGKHLASLLVGTYLEETFCYFGRVSSGLSVDKAEKLQQQLVQIPRSKSPFKNPPQAKNINWVEPIICLTVQFLEWTPDLKLRTPVIVSID